MPIKLTTKALQTLDETIRGNNYCITMIRCSNFSDVPDIRVSPVEPRRYMPEIYQEDNTTSLRYRGPEQTFKCGTVSYDSLPLPEYEKFVEDCCCALRTVRVLNGFDLSTIEPNDYCYEEKADDSARFDGQ